jgi:hypothetical protein
MSLKPIRVAADRWNFQTPEGEYVVPVGGNVLTPQHPSEGTLFDRFDAHDVDRRLAVMADSGLNCLRQPIGVNQVFRPDGKGGGELRADGMRNWDTFIECAQRRGIYLMPVVGYIGSNDWFDPAVLADSGRALDESCVFWSRFCAHYAGHPAVFAWDLRNELLYDTQPHFAGGTASATREQVEHLLLKEWPAYLRTRYGSVDVANQLYQTHAHAFDQIPGNVRFEEAPYDLRRFDFRNYLNERGYAWCKPQVEAIRAASPEHLVCSGNNTWLSPEQDLWLANGFHNRALHDLFDFVTHHPYPALQCMEHAKYGDPLNGGEAMAYWLHACIGMSRLDYYGKPVVIQEFGWYGGGESAFLCPLPYRSEQEHALYIAELITNLLPHAVGFLNWPTFDMPEARDISNHGGIFRADGSRKALTATFEGLARQVSGSRQLRACGTITLCYSLLGMYTSRKYQDQMWDQVHEVIGRGETPDFRFV